MTKLNITFSDFSNATQALGRAVEQSEKIFFLKCPKAGKVEINLHSGTFTVGSGSKQLFVITEAVEKAGFKIAKRAKGWTVVSADGFDQGDLLTHFCELYKVVEGSVAVVSAKSSKTSKTVNSAKSKATLDGMLNAALGGKSKSTKSGGRKAA